MKSLLSRPRKNGNAECSLQTYWVNKKKKTRRKDVHNLRQNSKRPSDNQEDKLLAVLEDFLEKDQQNVVNLTMNKDDELEVLLLQTSSMRKLACLFPEVLILDSTYRINTRKMPLSTIMAMDGNGKGRVVAHALLKNERQQTLRHFLHQFKRLNPSVEQTKIFLVDKDFNEMALIKELWPDSDIFLCLFHVLKTLQLKISSLQITADEKDKLKKLCQEVVYARSEKQYDEAYSNLQKEAPPQFTTYFTENWHNCNDMWAEFSRRRVSHMGNRTTNRVESITSLSECIAELIRFDKGQEMESLQWTVLDKVSVSYTHGNHVQ